MPTKKPIHDHAALGPLTCFAVNPKGIRFETQEAKENVVLFLRQHLVVNVGWIALIALMVLAPTLFFPFFLRYTPMPQLPIGYFVVGTVFWYVATFGFALANFLYWFFNIYIVTNERIVDIDFLYLLYKQFSQAELTRIQDITYTTGGIFAALFNYGNVYIQTAGELPNLEFEKVPHPEQVVETIRTLAGLEKKPV
ncbi:PH domain-containing protein [Candidatus Gottesmanbacteria bacterium]|nr:PH domain-containing protein [Candidatus Gottesmanbacteria bacterium]